MNVLIIILSIFSGVGITLGLVYIFKEKLFGKETDTLEQKLNEIVPQALKLATEQLITLSDQKLDAKKEVIESELANKKSAIEDLIKNIKVELDNSNKKLELAEKERVGSFREIKVELENQRRISEQLSVTTDNLRKVLSNNQLRGQFGEQVAEELLRMTGFVRGVDYEYNIAQGAGTRPDFTIFLPDGVKINVDAKFPYANLQRYLEHEDKESQSTYLKHFETDIKEKIKQVTTRDYINPEENTVDFVILFIPNEMIFSFIYEKLNSVWEDGMRKRVVFVGPFNFTATLRLIRQSYANFKIQNNIHKIVSLIKEFEKEYEKYNEEFIKIGDRIKSLSKQYDEVDTTRTRQLSKAIEKIRLQEPQELPMLTEKTQL